MTRLMHTNLVVLLTCTAVAVPALTAAQVRPGQLMAHPRSMEPFDPERVEDFRDVEPSEVWRVRAAFDGTEVFPQPGAARATSRLGFLELLLVSETREVDGAWWLRLCRSDAGRIDDPNATVNDVGWVPASQLLLSNGPLRVSRQNMIPRKAYVFPDIVAHRGGGGPSKNPPLRWTLGGSQPHGELVHGEFVYIFKTARSRDGKEWLLVLSENNISSMHADGPEVVQKGYTRVGWVRRAEVVDWPTREAVQWFRGRRREAPVFQSQADLHKTGEDRRLLYEDYDFRNPPDRREQKRPAEYRYPILQYFESTHRWPHPHAKVSILYEQSDANNRENALASVPQTDQEIREYLSRVNIVFVMDGTQSMEDAFKTVKTSVEQVARSEFVKKIPGTAALKFGAVIYRDLYAGDGIGKDRIIEEIPLNPDPDDFVVKIGNVHCSPQSVRINDNRPEALFGGIHHAVEKLVPASDRTGINVLIVIGDIGTSPDPQYTPPRMILSEHDLAGKIPPYWELLGVLQPTAHSDGSFEADIKKLHKAWTDQRRQLLGAKDSKPADSRQDTTTIRRVADTEKAVEDAICTQFCQWRQAALIKKITSPGDLANHPCAARCTDGPSRSVASTGLVPTDQLRIATIRMKMDRGLSEAEANREWQAWSSQARQYATPSWVQFEVPFTGKDNDCADIEKDQNGRCVRDILWEKVLLLNQDEFNMLKQVVDRLADTGSATQLLKAFLAECRTVTGDWKDDIFGAAGASGHGNSREADRKERAAVRACLHYRTGVARLANHPAFNMQNPFEPTTDELATIARALRPVREKMLRLHQERMGGMERSQWRHWFRLGLTDYIWLEESIFGGWERPNR